MRITILVIFLISVLSIDSSLGQNSDIEHKTIKESITDRYFTTSDGIKLHYLTAGKGPTIIIQPGWMMPADIFKPQLEKLSNSFKIIVLDPRGQGQSEDSPDNNYIERRTRDLFELIAHEKVDTFILAGWSLGVPEVLYFLDKYGKSQLRGLILIDGPIKTDLPEVQSGWKSLINWLQKDRSGLEKVFMDALFNKEHDEEFITLIQKRLSNTPTNSSFVAMGTHVAEPRDYSTILEKVQVPILITYSPTWKNQSDEFKEANNLASLEMFECGHALFVDESERFNSLIRNMFKEK
jgi:microsomal epoxide hydrolase